MSDTFRAVSKTLLNASQDAVWEAVTDPGKVKQYFFGSDLGTTWDVGSPITFKGEWQGSSYEDKGIVKAFDPPHKLIYEIPGKYGIVTYELAPQGEQTELTITQAEIATEQERHQMQQNWSMVLDSMKKMLEG